MQFKKFVKKIKKSEFVKLDEICQNDVRIFSYENNSTKYVWKNSWKSLLY